MSVVTKSTELVSISDRVKRVAKIAAAEADAVDRSGTAPAAAVRELKEQGLLAPGPARGGAPWTARQVATVASTLGGACASTGMIWAMHQGQLQCVRRLFSPTPELAEFLERTWTEQPLIASLMSETGAADPRQGNAFCEPHADSRVVIDKAVSVASYLDIADAALVVARRGRDAPAGEQVMVLAARENIETSDPVEWNALGMRGTLSGGCRARATAPSGHVLTESFNELSARTMAPLTHIGWASCWWGIASSAADRARTHLRRRSARASNELVTAKTLRLGRLTQTLDQARGLILVHAGEYDDLARGTAIDSGFARRTNNVRLAVADLAVSAVVNALELIGVDAYREPEASPVSLSRHLRDVLSAKVMISSDRMQLANGTLALLPEHGLDGL